GHGWIVDAESSAATCITCDMGDAELIPGAFTYAFPDQKRLLVANELGDKVFILECETSLASCEKHTWLPVDLSGDGGPNLGRRTYHLAPDGIHLAYSNTRADGLIMMISTIQRQATDYKLVDYRVVNPPAPTGPFDGDINRWINGSTLSEFKSFADGGASMIFVTESASADVDMYKMNLKTGAYTRITSDPDWDEDGAPAPDNSSVVAASWRTMDRLSKLGRFTPQPPFGNLPLGAGLAINYVSSRPGFACDLQPWLLDGTGDSKGRLGQPLLPYTGGDVIAGNNLSGVSFWSPDSTKVLLQERLLSAPDPAANDYVQQKGGAPNRLAIAKIARPATQPVPTVVTEVGAWATTPAQYKGSNAYPGVRVFPGSHGGTLTLTQAGDLVAGTTTMVYNRFSRDGITFLDGIEEVTGSPAATINYLVNLTATDALGKKTGGKTGALEFTTVPGAKPGQPPMTMTG
ncbi:hypothetical protein, partial [Pseudarthrobacter scleromae]|uniref:hypothetical protein n=1 Tax=Pseudarthrobacter scleromae TaxID=158897 RepID=UPI003CFBF027